MIVINPTGTSDPASDHSPPDTDLPFAVIIIAIFILALAFYLLSYLLRPGDRPELISDDIFEPVTLDQTAPARACMQWKAETNYLADIESGFNAW
ncbi:uncharacterized protein FRV6_11716 [Fusarium oxysporum]|uniref:Uncharacterized protein n=1 Tax=Fusarium oxysporum TaxID=5507 RepID=A0A2H3U075_FUSOX|nr:uncharacterized protein FRV6_11716 [Fusarium oxysporum]